MGNPRETKPSLDEKYSLPEIQSITCPRCKEGIIDMNRTLHKLPDGEEILILLMECNSCAFSRSDVIPLVSAFQAGIYTLEIDDGDLTAKIFRSPSGIITLPEADFEIEPGQAAEYLITNVEGILNRMIRWSKVMLSQYDEKELEHKKVESTLKILTECITGGRKFHLILSDNVGGSYISTSNKESLHFQPFSS